MKRRVFEILPGVPRGWILRERGRRRAFTTTRLKRDAIRVGRRLGRENAPAQLVVRRRDGRFATEYTYGADPFPPRG